MTRKDCDRPYPARRFQAGRAGHRARLAGWSAALLAGLAGRALAGSVRLWPDAVAAGEEVRLADLCELRDFDAATERALRDRVVTAAPPSGGSRVVHLEMIREALIAGGVNMAEVTLRGATQCAVTRPAAAAPHATPVTPTRGGIAPAHPPGGPGAPVSPALQPAADAASAAVVPTLRGAVQAHFDEQFRRYAGRAEVLFDRTSEQILGLAGPAYEFRVDRQRGTSLGLAPIEVQVRSGGEVLQTVSMVVQVSMIRRAVVARRSINQDAAIRPGDVETTSITFGHLDRLGLDDVAQAVGQRARQFIQAGTLILPEMLESVPLVRRGELVTLAAVAGGIRVVTTAKAAGSGVLGDVVKVRAIDDKRVEFDAVVVGPGEVQIGESAAVVGRMALAMGEDQ